MQTNKMNFKFLKFLLFISTAAFLFSIEQRSLYAKNDTPLSIVYDINASNEKTLYFQNDPAEKQTNYYDSVSFCYALCPNFKFDILQNKRANIQDNVLKIGTEILEKTIKQAIEKELEFKDNFFVFYHGQKREFMILQDLYSKIYELFNKKKINDFFFLRIPSPTFDKFENIDQFLSSTSLYPQFDNDPSINKFILSVNVSLFGNSVASIYNYLSECTFKYFVRSKNITSPDLLDLCQEIFSLFNISPQFYSYKNKIYDLIQLLAQNEKTKTGILIQIFVPPTLINALTYRATQGGMPFYSSAYNYKKFDTQKILKKYKKTLKEMSLDNYYSFLNNKIFGNHIDVDGLQFRLLISNRILLNPDSGIKMFRYFNETENVKQYKIELEKLISQLEQEIKGLPSH